VDATPSVPLPVGASTGIPQDPPAPLAIRGRSFVWGSRTFLMGVVNVTPDSFSGDGLLATPGGDSDDAVVSAAVAQAVRMVVEGADLLDIGGESSRPGHPEVAEDLELRRVVPVVQAVRAALPEIPISVDTVKLRVAAAALDAGADMINDVCAVGADDALARLAAERRVTYVVMHTRTEARYRNLVAEILAELQRAVDRAVALGAAWESLIVDPGIGFGKTPEQNLAVLRRLDALRVLGRPILVGTSRKSTIGKVLDLPAGERVEGTLATTALAVARGADIVRIHDVEPNRRAARMADAVEREGRIGEHGWEPR